MSFQSFAAVLQHVHRLGRPTGGDGSDSALLERFVGQQDRDAFAELVERHGSLVLRVCRRILNREHDVEDAFQATFLILARKARGIRKERSIASWLHTVAQRVAWSARAGLARRHLLEQRVSDMQWVETELSALGPAADGDPARLAQRRELEAVIEQELARLPDKYRAPLVLCDLQGRTHGEAAQELGLPAGSISRHLERGRELLRERLARRGVGLGAGALAALLVERTQAAVPAAWVRAASEAAALWASGSAIPAGLVSARAVTLSQGVLQAMSMKNLKVLLLSLLTVGLLGGGMLAFAARGAAPAPAQEKKAAAAEPDKKQEAAPPGLRARFSVSEKPKEQQGMTVFVSVRAGGLFFSADGATLYVQRGGFGGFAGMMGGAAGGLGGGGGGGFGGAGFGGVVQDYLTVWDLAAKKKVKEIVGSESAVLSPSGKTIALVGVFNKKRYLRLVNAKTGKVAQSVELPLPGGLGGFGGMAGLTPVFTGSLAFTPDARRVLVRDGFEPGLRLWDLQSNKLLRSKAGGMHDFVGVLPDGKAVVGTALGMGFGGGGLGGFGGRPAGQGLQPLDKAIGVWELASGKLLRSFGDTAFARGVLAPKGTTVATFSRNGFLGMGGFGVIGGGGGAGGAGGAGGGGLGGLGGIGGFGGPAMKPAPAQLKLWDAATGKALATCETKVTTGPVQQKFGNGGFFGMPGGVFDAAFSPDGRTLGSCMSGGEGGYVHLWDTRTGREILSAKLKFCPQAIAFSRDGSQLATAGGLGGFELRVWDVTGLGSPGETVKLDAAQLPNLWADLAADDAAKALGAERTLSAAAPKLVVPLLKDHLKPVATDDAELQRLARLLSDLDSAQFKVREKATRELSSGGMTAAAVLKHALKSDRPVEFRRRAEGLVSKLEEKAALTPEQRRQQRALTVLEILGTAEARRVLDELAKGAPQAWLTQEAEAARQRLGERKLILPAP